MRAPHTFPTVIDAMRTYAAHAVRQPRRVGIRPPSGETVTLEQAARLARCSEWAVQKAIETKQLAYAFPDSNRHKRLDANAVLQWARAKRFIF